MKSWMTLGTLVGLVTVAPVAWAAGLHGRVGVLGFKGPGGKDVAAAVGNALGERGYRVIVLDEKDGEAPALARRLKLNALVSGRVSTQGRLRVARISVLGAEAGRALGEAKFSARENKALAAKVERDLWKDLGPALGTHREPVAANTPPPVRQGRSAHAGHAARSSRPASPGDVGNP